MNLRVSLHVGARGTGMNFLVDSNKARASTAAFDNSKKPFPQFASTFVTRTKAPRWRAGLSRLCWARGTRAVRSLLMAASRWAMTTDCANTLDPYNVTNKWTRDAADRRMYFVGVASWDLPVEEG